MISDGFSAPYRVRFDEAGADGRLRPSTMLRYLQDVAWQHSEAAGFDRDWYAARRLTWLVRAIELRLLAPAGSGDTVVVATRVTGWRRVWARRESSLTAPGGGRVAEALIDWVLLDATGRPVRIPSELAALARDPAPFEPLRVDDAGPPEDAIRSSAAVRADQIDPMGHLNNAAWLDLVTEALPAPPALGDTIRLEYLRPATPGMTLTVERWAGAGDQVVRVSSDGDVLLRARLVPAGGQPA